jgi:hypothetical protein
VNMQIFHAYQLRDGMVVRIKGYVDRNRALKAVGLEE